MPLGPSFLSLTRAGGTLAVLTALAGCSLPSLPTRTAPPTPLLGMPDEPIEDSPKPSASSLAVAAHFTRTEAHLRAQGLMRRDGGGPDTPFGPRELTENFVRIALYDEYVSNAGQLTQQETPSVLRRWQTPVRIGIRFGASVPEETRIEDRALITALASRLSRQTGLSIRVSDMAPNYWVYVVSEDERPGLGPEWARLFHGLDPRELDSVTGMGLSTFCMVLAISEGHSPIYSGALAVIRSELPPALRESCYHEEIAQGLGLANDYVGARPSIFNDDEEFATLTRMDELMLKMLYDRRLRPGMTEATVRPLLAPIIAELLPGDS